jgi:hypothetical protein
MNERPESATHDAVAADEIQTRLPHIVRFILSFMNVERRLDPRWEDIFDDA